MSGEDRASTAKKATTKTPTMSSNYFYDPMSGTSYNMDALTTPPVTSNPLFTGKAIQQAPPGIGLFHGNTGATATPTTDPVGAYTYSSMSPNDLLSQINSLYSGSSPDFTGEANKQASTIFAPVLNDLKAQGSAATKRSGQNDAQLKAMYSALQGGIGVEGEHMAAQNKTQVANIKKLGKQNVDSIGSNYDSAMSDASSTMARLGIQAAAPDALPRGAEHEALLQGLANLNTQGASNLATQLGTNAQHFNSSQKNIAGFEGTENRGLNRQHTEDILAGLASQRAQVGSQQASQAAGFTSNLQNQYLNSVNQKASALTQMYSQQQAAAMQQQSQQMDLMKMQMSQQPSAYQQYQMTPSADKLAAYAGQLFGAGGNTASKVLSFIESMGGQQAPSALAFADMVAKAASTQGDPELKTLNPNQLRALAMQAYSQMGVNPNPMNYLGQG